jgi:hypothetical protein
MHATTSIQTAIDEGGAFIALAAVLTSLVAIPVFQANGYGPLGFALGGVLALGCVGVLHDRINRLRQ